MAQYYLLLNPHQIRNSESQYKRMQKHLKILGGSLHCFLARSMVIRDRLCSGQKSSKTKSFSECYQMLVLTGGGDTNNLLCRGELQSNYTETLRTIGD